MDDSDTVTIMMTTDDDDTSDDEDEDIVIAPATRIAASDRSKKRAEFLKRNPAPPAPAAILPAAAPAPRQSQLHAVSSRLPKTAGLLYVDKYTRYNAVIF